MRFNITVDVEEQNIDKAKADIQTFLIDAGMKVIEIKKVSMTRSAKQSRALHLWFQQIAEACVENGIDVRIFFERLKKVEVPITKEFLKEVWRYAQKKMTGKKSTTRITTKELNDIQDVYIRGLSQLQIDLPPFPSIEYLVENFEKT